MSSLKTWIWFSLAGGCSSGKTKALLSHFGSVEKIYAAGDSEYREVEVVSDYDVSKLSDKSTERAERIIDDCARLGIRIITMQDVAYPDRLKQISMPPPVLYMRGCELDIDDEVAIAIVGTRSASNYGLRAADKVAGEIAMCGGVVVSGLARGIDTAALRSAVNAGGRTIAVLGSGIDVCYPRENRELLEAITYNGMVISEFPPGTEPHSRNFPRRNRVMSGISVGTLVVEAPARSGALITAGLALEQDRDVFAVMGGIFSPECEGSNRLICEGAHPVRCGRDVLAEYSDAFPHRINLRARAERPALHGGVSQGSDIERAQGKAPQRGELSPEYLARFDEDDKKIISAIGWDTLNADEISQRCGFTAQKVLSLLTLLEIGGNVVQESGSRFRLKIDG